MREEGGAEFGFDTMAATFLKITKNIHQKTGFESDTQPLLSRKVIHTNITAQAFKGKFCWVCFLRKKHAPVMFSVQLISPSSWWCYSMGNTVGRIQSCCSASLFFLHVLIKACLNGSWGETHGSGISWFSRCCFPLHLSCFLWIITKCIHVSTNTWFFFYTSFVTFVRYIAHSDDYFISQFTVNPNMKDIFGTST